MFTPADADYLDLWLSTIGSMCCPRQHWAARNQLSQAETERTVRRIFFGTVSFWCELIDYPDKNEIDYHCHAGHRATEEDRRGDLAAFKKRPGCHDAVLVFDCDLCFVYSRSAGSVVFTSNVELGRIEDICRLLQANTVVFAHRVAQGIALHFMGFSRDDFLKELDEEQIALERDVRAAMQKYHSFSEQVNSVTLSEFSIGAAANNGRSRNPERGRL